MDKMKISKKTKNRLKVALLGEVWDNEFSLQNTDVTFHQWKFQNDIWLYGWLEGHFTQMIISNRAVKKAKSMFWIVTLTPFPRH